MASIKYNVLDLRITFKSVVYYLLIVSAYSIWFYCIYNLIAHGTFWPYSEPWVMLILFGLNLLPTLFLSAGTTCIVFFTPPVNKNSWASKIFFDALGSILWAILFYTLYEFVIKLYTKDYMIIWGGVVLNIIMILAINEMVFYFLESRRVSDEMAHAKQSALQLRYDVLKAQINPHFLFNSLNNLCSLIELDQQRAIEFTMSLSQTYRYIMTQQDRPRVKLHEEMKFAKSYINVLRIRYNNNFQAKIIGEELMGEHEIIPYSLQLLIENVGKHNIIGSNYPMLMEIEIRQNDVQVRNPIRLKESQTDTHLGIRYLTELYAFHGLQFTCRTENNTFIATIPYLK